MKNWCVYILKCDKSNKLAFYTGITNDFEKRCKKHVEGKGARFTRSFPPFEGAVIFRGLTRSEALKVERKVKKYTKLKKSNLFNISETVLLSYNLMKIFNISLHVYGNFKLLHHCSFYSKEKYIEHVKIKAKDMDEARSIALKVMKNFKIYVSSFGKIKSENFYISEEEAAQGGDNIYG